MKVLYALLVFVPIALVARLAGASPIAVFILSAFAIIPLSGVLGAATEAVAEHTSPAIGGVLSATMARTPEPMVIGRPMGDPNTQQTGWLGGGWW